MCIPQLNEFSNRQDFENILRSKVYFLLKSKYDFSHSIINSIDFAKNENLIENLYDGNPNILKCLFRRC